MVANLDAFGYTMNVLFDKEKDKKKQKQKHKTATGRI